MKRIADATGGNVTYHTNDLKEAVSTAAAYGGVSYTLGFYPADEKYDGKLHDLKVKVDRKDVDLHYRAGYYATANTLTDKERKDLVRPETSFDPYAKNRWPSYPHNDNSLHSRPRLSCNCRVTRSVLSPGVGARPPGRAVQDWEQTEREIRNDEHYK